MRVPLVAIKYWRSGNLRELSKGFVLLFVATLSSLAVAVDEGSDRDAEIQRPRENRLVALGDRSIVIVHVDGTRTHGNTNVARGKSLQIAKAAAVSGDTVIVGPGNHKITSSLAKDGVNWQFMPGSSVTRRSEEHTSELQSPYVISYA